MNVLIIDDSNAKIVALTDVVRGILIGCNIVARRSFQKALKELENNQYEIVLLDMTLPTTERNDGRYEGRIRYFGGRELLGEMELLDYRAKVVIVTQFDRFDDGIETVEYKDLISGLNAEFGELLAGSVFYSSISDRWIQEVEQILKSIKES